GIMVFAAGTEVSEMPATGEFNYEGANFAIEFLEGENGADEHIGSFNATVDFAAGEGSIGLDFENELLYIDGDFTVDTATGIFVGDKLEMKSIGIFDTATIHGNFHGVGATGMTGIYTNNIADPNFIGAIAGTQVTPTVIIDSLDNQSQF
ncbi:hypothetical protein N9582_06525, partial [Amylibacter sp.]|nr:hypothetical protein [Amylibacter sp.]